MAKAKKQGASKPASKAASHTGATKKKATRVKKPAAVKKATKGKAVAAPKRKAPAVARSRASTAKKVARKTHPVGATPKAAAKSPKPSSKKTTVRSTKTAAPAKMPVPQTPSKPAVAASRVVSAAPAEFHSPATTVAKIRAAAANAHKAAKAPMAAAAPKTANAPKKAQRRPVKAATLVVSPTAIDTALAAEVAANMVLNHMVRGPAAGHLERAVTDVFTQASAAAARKPFGPKQPFAAKTASSPKRETSTFKHMKEAVANPTAHHLDGLFGVLATTKRPALPFGRYPTGAAQPIDKDFGLDVKRTNLPRRKAG